MANAAFIPSIWSARFLMNLERYAVFKMLANKDWEGDIQQAGNTVKIPTLSTDITVGDYAVDTAITAPQNVTGTTQDLVVDQQKFFHFFVDRISEAQSTPNVMDEAMRKAALKIVDTQDDFMSGIFQGAKAAGRTLQVDNTQVKTSVGWVQAFLKSASELKQKMSEANVPLENRWLVIPPVFVKRLEDYLAANASNTVPFLPVSADQALMNGFAGMLFGMKLYVSNHLKEVTISSKTYYDCISSYGTEAVTVADQIISVESYSPELKFGEAVKGLYVYGAKAVHASRIWVLQGEK